MQYFDNGPNIPDELISACLAGNVVFFCGAGVSRAAGLPGFKELTDQLIEVLAPEPESNIWRLYEQKPAPYADIYQVMQEEFGEEQVENIISEILKPKDNPDTTHHQNIFTLSTDPDGNPQVVTTNIDTLFEENTEFTDPPHIAPRLPQISPDRPFSGLAYLHGRWQEPDQGLKRKDYIFSSADFGRAYLAEGWATGFLKDLLSTGKSIVFVGYLADDPPVKYLLQGLHAGRNKYPLYAFSDYDPKKSMPEMVQRAWRNKGVTVIPYSSENDHAALWKSLQQWSAQKVSPEIWMRRMELLAQTKPSKLNPFERAQIITWLNTPEGRDYFNSNQPPAEWICVIDPAIRHGEPVTIWGDQGDTNKFDPYEVFGLPEESRPEARRTETEKKRCEQLFNSLSLWFCKHLDQSITAWWIVRQPKLPCELQKTLIWTLQSTTPQMSPNSATCWSLLELAINHKDPAPRFIRKKSKNSHEKNLLLLQEFLTPIITARQPISFWNTTFYPEEWNLFYIADFKVEFPLVQNRDTTVDDQIDSHQIFRIYRNALEHAALLLAQIPERGVGWRTADLPDGKNNNRCRNIETVWMDVGKQFHLLCIADPEKARAEVEVWPGNEPFFFDKLRIYAWSHLAFSPEQAADKLMALSDESFWNSNHTTQITGTLKKRWSDFSNDAQARIEQRLCTLWKENDSSDKKLDLWWQRKSLWKQLNHVQIEFSENTKEYITQEMPEELQPAIAAENKTFRETAKSLGVIDDRGLTNPLPLDPNGSELRNKSYFSFHDFETLSRQEPMEALAVLQAVSEPEQPTAYWQALALYDRAAHTPKNRRTLVRAFLALPQTMGSALLRFIPDWLHEQLSKHPAEYREEALQWWDDYFNLLMKQDNVRWVSNHENISNQSHVHLSQSPVFIMVDCLLKLPKPHELVRYEQALALPDVAQQQAVCALASHLGCLFKLDRDWTIQNLLPCFRGETAEAAWSGFFSNPDFSGNAATLCSHLKNAFLEAAHHCTSWSWENSAPTCFASLFCHSSMHPRIPDAETRQLLRDLCDEGRCEVIREISCESLGALMTTAWPLDKACKTEALSKALTDALIETEDDFPAALTKLIPFLVPQQEGFLPDLGFVEKFPEQFLILLARVVPDRFNEWYVKHDFLQILNRVTTADPSLKNRVEWRHLNSCLNSPE